MPHICSSTDVEDLEEEEEGGAGDCLGGDRSMGKDDATAA
jgi:hypothetical protein